MLPSLPGPTAIAKGVVITAIALVIINVVKPYLPVQVQNLLRS